MYNFLFGAVKHSPHNIQTTLACGKHTVICLCVLDITKIGYHKNSHNMS